MQTARLNPFTRDDTFLGVCQAISDDFGFNPLYLRLAFAPGLLWSPVAVLSVYLGLGVIVLASRLLAPSPRRAVARAEAQPTPVGDNDSLADALAAAA